MTREVESARLADAASGASRLVITAVETVQVGQFPNLVWVRLHTDEGPVGLGETFYGAYAVAAYIHESVAPQLLGQDPLRIDLHATRLRGYLGYSGTGVENRGNSAVDIALWDLFGKATGLPVHQLLGGATRDRIRVYNTCAGPEYIRSRPQQAVDNWGLSPDGQGRYEDLAAFMTRPGELARELLAEGITGMKIWPFDPYAEASGGQYISAADLELALCPFREIREAVGNAMDVMVEFHGLWSVPMAKRIVRALEPYDPFWLEDPIRMGDLASLRDLAETTPTPITASETLGSRAEFRALLEQRAVGIVMLDVSWAGGLGEAKKIGAMAEAFGLPVAPHDCTGPVVLTAGIHLCANLPNALVQETVRASYRGWYLELVTELPPIVDGHVQLPGGPGLGVELLPDLAARPDAKVTVSAL